MRVLHVVQPVEAGVAVVVADLVRHQRLRGWDATAASPATGWLPDQFRDAGVGVHDWPAVREPGLGVVGEVRALRRIVERTRPDVVHLHSAKAGLAGRLALRGALPTLFQPHAWSFDATAGVTEALARRWEQWAQRWTDHLICVSDDELRVARSAGIAAAASVVPNGVDLTRWTEGDRFSARDRLGLRKDSRLAVCVGRLAEQKGQDLLLSVWPSIIDAVPDAALALVGDGPRGATWRERWGHEASVRWVGQADPRDWYQAADVVVVPSRWEGMALTPLEAMACARSVVAFAVSGARESIGDAGSVVAVGDTAALATALRVRLLNQAVAAEEGRRGRCRVKAKFNVEVALRRTTELTEKVAAQRSA